MSGKPGEKVISVQAWPGPGDQLTRAISGPFRAVVTIQINKVGWVRNVYKCRHRHATVKDAFACPSATEKLT